MTESTAQVNVEEWLDALLAKLRKAFGSRLLFVGLQGSYRRGEATPESDIDAVVILDRLDMDDLVRYRGIIESLPRKDKACGFVSGREELRRWPAHEIFQFYHDTRPYHGSLDDLVPPVARHDIVEGAKTGASAIYHFAGHSYLHAQPEQFSEILAGLFKGSFFVLQALHYLRTGDYIASKRGLLEKLEGRDRAMLAASIMQRGEARNDPDAAKKGFELALQWSAAVLREMSELA